jgi:N-acetyl-anhydromuramyl-L-alanine amidase AmpD
VKFAILHHGACSGSRFHYRIDRAGESRLELAESDAGQHPGCIGIVVDGNADAAAPTEAQLAALRKLLLQLKSRYPDIQIGGHRQVRGETTSCPGKAFPLTAIRDWAGHDLIIERDNGLQDMIDRQYRL